MEIAVRYYTKTGNTKKIAVAIAGAVGVEARDVNERLSGDVDILFLGSSIYAAGVADEVKQFMKKIDVNVGCIVNFSSAALLKSTFKKVSSLAAEKGIRMSDKEYHCKGEFKFINKGRPNPSDLKEAAYFAKTFLKE